MSTGRGVVDVGGLPTTRWRLGEHPDRELAVPTSGLLLGRGRGGERVGVPVTGAEPVRLGVVGGIGPARLLAYRLLGIGFGVTASTHTPRAWGRLRQLTDGRLALVQRRASWPPPGRVDPPGVGAGPQALITDLPESPARWIGRAPWCTVVHAVPVTPGADAFWSTVDAVLVSGRGHGQALSALLGSRDVARIDDLGAGELAVCTRSGFTAVRPILGPTETELISDHVG